MPLSSFARTRCATTGIATLISAAVAAPLLIAAGSAPASASASTVRMSAASSAVKDAAGRTWAAGAGFDKGDRSTSYWGSFDIAGTSDDELYRHEIVRMNSWSTPLGNGTYEVTLKMREAWWNAPGQRVFDVRAENTPVLTGVDIVKAVGKNTAYDRTFRVTVKDGRLDLGFSAKADSALVSAIQVVPVATAPTPAPAAKPTPAPKPTTGETRQVVTRMSAYPHPVKDALGNVFAARSGFVGGDFTDLIPASTDVRGTTSDVLYRPELTHWTSWSKALPNGTYDVTLKMREGYFDRAGQRVFDIRAEGKTALAAVDIVKAAGKNAAYDRTFRVEVKDGRLDLAPVNRANVAPFSAMTITRIGKAQATPATPAPKPAPTPATPAPKPAPAPLGNRSARPSGMIFDSGVFPMHKASVATKFGQDRGAANDVIAVFPTRDSWNSLLNGWWMDDQRIPADFKGTLNVGMPMWPQDGNLATAARGGYNEQWKSFARMLAKKYPNAYVRPGWEMNLPGWYYAATPATKDQWIAAWRHAVTAMRAEAPGLRMVWNPNEGRGQTGTPDAAMFWPGDAYVDIVGIDAYDWWPRYTTDANIARHRDGEYGWNHWLNFAKAHGKKFAVPEWGVAPANGASGGDNPKYIAFVYDFLEKNAAHIAFETYFQESDSYIRSDLFTNSPKATAEYVRWVDRLKR